VRSRSQSFLRQPLSAVFGQGSDVRVLRELSRHGGELTVSALVERTKLTRPSVLATLAALTSQGLVEALGASHRLYRFDHSHPLAPALSALFAAEDERFRGIIQSLRTAAVDAGADAAWLYGSVARGEDRPDSDIDVAAVSAPGRAESTKARLRELLRDTEDRLRFSASVIVLEPGDIPRLAAGNDPWWCRMIQETTPLVGLDPTAMLARISANMRGVA
jgi:predicted nucleotidyltransferase